MNILEAKSIRIVDYLEHLNIKPVKVRGSQYWYLSPIRPEEKSASFKVEDAKNVWFDFGLGVGGGILKLVELLNSTTNALDVLSSVCDSSMVRVRPQHIPPKPAETLFKNIVYQPLTERALCSYLRTRSVNVDIARQFCQEVHYEVYKNPYYALSFQNMSGGHDVRNPFFKGCLGRKDITIVKQDLPHEQKTVNVFEGFMDFLSYLTLQDKGDSTICHMEPADHLIMNSTSMLKKTLEVLGSYDVIHCYLDNDLSGQKTTETIVGLYGDKVIDESLRYRQYNDVNDFLRGKIR